MAAAKILITEDELVTAAHIQQALERLGYDVCACIRSGEEVVEAMRRWKPDLVLMDIKLKGALDGIQVAEQLRAEFDVPVIYVTAFADSATLQRAKISEPFAYVVKPVDTRAFHTAIELALTKHAAEQRLKESRRWITAILNNVRDGVIATDPDGAARFLNPIAEQITGWSSSDAALRNLSEVLRIVRPDTGVAECHQLHGSEPVDTEADGGDGYLVVETKAGQRTPVERSIDPIHDDHGEVTGFVVTLHDISERIAAEASLIERNRELSLVNSVISAAGSQDAGCVLETACRELTLATGAVRTLALLLEPRTTSVHVAAEYPPPSSGVRCADPGPYLSWWQSCQANDVEWLDLEDRSGLVFPFVIDGQPAGCLYVEVGSRTALTEHRTRMVRAVTEEVANALARTRLAETRDQLLAAMEQAEECIVITDPAQMITYVNRAFERTTGYAAEEVVGRHPYDVLGGKHSDGFRDKLTTTLAAGEAWHGHLRTCRKSGEVFTAYTTITPVRGRDGSITAFIGLQRDVTREMEMAELYQHAHKMQVLGQMAAGIAHDFNNHLTMVIGYADLIATLAPGGSPLIDMAHQVLKAGRACAAIVDRLLAFSRKQMAWPRPVNLNEIVARLTSVLKQQMRERVRVSTEMSPDLWAVHVDPSQMENVLVSLAANSYDAMPDGGTLTIRTANSPAYEASSTGWPGPQVGDCVVIEVEDTGTGMPPEVQSHLFEPFFTTKEVGKGVGLGLAAAQGIVAQHGGRIEVTSEVGHGSTFRIILPALPAARGSLERPTDRPTAPPAAATVLLVEHDVAVAELVTQLLKSAGYRVLVAWNAEMALPLATRSGQPLDLLLTEATEPGEPGFDVTARIIELYPRIKTLSLSGALGAAHAVGRWQTSQLALLLQEPDNPDRLIRAVRRVLVTSA